MSLPVNIVVPNQPDIKVFYASSATKVTAFGLIGDDCITFKLVRETADSPKFSRNGCFASVPTENEIKYATDYMVGTCKPTMFAGRNTIILPRGGSYLPIINGSDSDGGLTIQVELVDGDIFTNAEIGIEPCGCPCKDTTWTWTGGVRCTLDKINVEREEESNCGNTRWVIDHEAIWTETGNTRCNGSNVEAMYTSECGGVEWRVVGSVAWVATGETRCENHVIENKEVNDCGNTRWITTTEVCGYSPSVPFVIEVFDGCCGGKQVGYMYHPDETRDPAATVAVEDCDGIVWGYIYPTAATGRTLPVGACDESPIGYAFNQSSTAPQFAQCGGDTPIEVIVPEPPRSVLSVGWSGDNLLLTYSDGSNQTISTPVC